jgi:flagellar hook-associated protein 2
LDAWLHQASTEERMGTVGLSFGSPTSGAGFDVSATVASIVSNLRNVETPWNTELTTLQSQDTVFSNMGTLFSNLSNDLGSLTDLAGIMAQKTGSSSDTNVLELTSASASAEAGTHTVIVNSLAESASGYLAPITNASDTLSGSLSIAVGSATPTTITINSSNNTLAGLAQAINNSAAGVTASVLTDSTGSRLSLVSSTSGAAGNFTVTSSVLDTSNSNAALGYTGSVTGVDASLKVDGVNLSSASNTVTGLIPGVTFQLLAPSPTESDASLEQVQVIIGNDTTDAGSTINQFVNDYNSLITAMNAQESNTSSGASEPLYGSPTLSLLQQQLLSGLSAQNPNGYLDQIANASDSLSGSISIQVGSGTAKTVTLSPTGNTLAGLASAINSASIGVTASVVTSSTGSQLELVSGTAGQAGALTVTSAITDTTTSKALNYNNEGSDISGLANLGITVSTADNGTISLDDTALTSALNSDFSGVVGFFQNVNSWGQTFSTLLTNSGSGSSTGILALAESSNSTVESTLNANISKEEIQISAEQKSITNELNTANQILQALPQQLNSANELYSAITGYNENQDG